MKKLLSILLTIVLLMSVVPMGAFTFTASAATEYTDGYYTYTVLNDEATITDVDTSISGNVTIPSILGGYKVTSIGDYAFYNCTGLTSVTIPDSVTNIGYCAFYNCDGLTNITIPEGVTNIGYYAFSDCTRLTSVTIPDSVTSIGSSAFKYCTGLTSMTIPDSVTSIGSSAFEGCTSLTNITIPDSVTSIGSSAFEGCTGLTSMTIPDSVTSIGHGAFDSYSLTEINVDENNKKYSSVDGVLFNKEKTALIRYPEGKTNVTYIIPDSVTIIDRSAFDGCRCLTEINVDKNNKSYSSVDGVLFNKEKTTLIRCPEEKTETSYIIPDSVTSIGGWAFNGCDNLTSVTIGNGVIEIEQEAFIDCDGLTCMVISDSVEYIGYLAFDSCDSLMSVTIGEGVKKMEGNTFSGCDKLTTVNYNAKHCTEMGGPHALDFDYCPITTINIGDNVEFIPEYAFCDCDSLTSITIPDSVTSIGHYAFAYCYNLTNITIPDSVINIDTDAFYGCNPIIVCNPNSFAETYAKENGFETAHILTKIKVTKLPNKTQYYDGDSIDLTGLEVTLYYYDGTSEIITDYTIGNYDNSAGDEQITVSYKGLTDVFIVNFAAIELSGIEVTKLPDNTSQPNEETLDFTGLEVTAYYNNGESKVITDYVIEDYDSTTAGTKTITVSYGGFSDSFEIEVLLINYRGQCGDNANWNFNSETGELIIAGSGTMYDYDITGEDAVPWLENIGQINVIEISNGITHIGSNAFAGCSGVKSITIPDSVESIGEFAFSNCGGMLNATFGNGLKSIGKEAFTDCTRLKRVYINDLANWCSIEFGTNANPLSNGGILYIDGVVANDIIIPDGVTEIAPNAFIGCVNIKNVTIPEGVTAIGENAFWGCSALTTVSIPSTVQTIGKQAFNLCEKLKNVYISDLSSWIKISFENYNANPLYIAKNLYIDGELIRNLIIPDGTTEIAPMAFYTFTGFDYVYIPASVTTVGEDAFFFCDFETVEFAEGAELILKDTLPFFASMGAHIIIPDSVVFIETDTISGTSTQIFGRTGSEAENYAIDNECQFYKIPVSIEVAQLPDRTTYYKESKNAMDYSFSTTGLKIKATYYDGTTEILEDGFKILGRDYPYIQEMATGTHPVKIWFGGKTTTFDITVYAKELTSIAVTENPVKTEYVLGEDFSHQGMIVTAYYKDGTSEYVQITDDMISGFDNTKTGTQLITVTYCGKTATFNVTVLLHAATEHKYDNACDTDCNECGAKRSVSHTYSNNCDSDCNVCGATRIAASHKYTNTCDTTCEICGAERSITHSYSNACDAECNICGFTRTPSDHVYDNACDINCNVCGTTRTVSDHIYDDKYDADCNECGAVRDVPDRDWQISPDATGVYNITPDKTLSGFNKDSITVFDKNGNVVKYNDANQGWPLVVEQTYTVKLNVEFEDVNNLTWSLTKKADTIFTDTSASGWYNDAVTYAVGASIMSGYANGLFGTSDSIQRQDFLVMLARLEGVDLTQYENQTCGFTDVSGNGYYRAAVIWGAQNGIVTGYQNGKFGVGDKVTREQLVTFLYRYAKYKGIDVKIDSSTEEKVSSSYTDYKNVSAFAKDAILWAIENGVISGKTATTIVPQGNAQRCEVAKIMYNIYLNDTF